jgi:hypothetical protein
MPRETEPRSKASPGAVVHPGVDDRGGDGEEDPCGEEADRPDVRSEQEQGQVPDTPHHTKDDARAQGAPDSLQKGQSKPTPSDLLAPRTAREELVPRMI